MAANLFNADQKMLARQLNLTLPPKPPPKITAAKQIARTPEPVL